MTQAYSEKTIYRALRITTLGAVMVWSLVLAGLLWIAILKEDEHVVELAQKEARTNFNKDVALRNWATRRGGVYVEIGKGTAPNPYLAHMPERDIESLSGRQFTLVNPAYMLRQTMDEFAYLYGIKGRLTSLTPLNPVNQPDAWEKKVLEQFQTGVDEVSEVAMLGGEPYLRYMQAFYTIEGCLKCHSHQGYQVGEVSGGVGVSVPLAPYLDLRGLRVKNLVFSYGAIWLLGLSAIGVGYRFSRKQVKKQWLADQGLLEKGRLLEQERQLFITGPTVVFKWRPAEGWPVVYVSPNVIEHLGYSKDELESGAVVFAALVHPVDLPRVGEEVVGYSSSGINSFEQEYRLRHKDGQYRWFYDLTNIIRDDGGQIIFYHGYIQDITERKQALERLAKSEAKYRSVINNTQEGFWFIDQEQISVEVNDALCALLGYRREDILRRSPLEFVDEENRRIFEEKLGKIPSSDHRVYDIALRHSEGFNIPVHISANTLWNEAGEVEGAFAFVSDLRERKRVENTLRETKDRLAFALEGAQEGLWDWNVETGEVYFSPRMETMLGYEPGEWRPNIETWELLVHPQDLDRVMQVLHEHLEGRTEFYQTEHRVRRKDGRWIWIRDSGCVVARDRAGRPLRAVGTHLDITERKEIEQALRRSQASLAEAQRLAKVGNWELDLQSNELHWSDEIYRIFEIDQARYQASYESFLETIHPEDRERVDRVYQLSLSEKRPYDITHRLLMKDGRVKYVHEICETDYDEAGEPISSRGTVQDVTERQLVEFELIQAKERAEAATQAKGDFLATMSHEIRTPMNGVIGMAELLADTELNGGQRESLEVIRSSGQLLLNIINDILEFSKLEAGQVELESISFDLEMLCFSVMELILPLADDKGLELIFDYPPDCPREYLGDPTRLRQILLNLLGNALKFTEIGFVRLAVEHREAAGGSVPLWFEIEDTGVGIESDKQNRLFEAFSQADQSTTRNYGGTGLGLSISKKLVNLMGGELKVESALGQGSVFHFELRLPRVEGIKAFEQNEMAGVRLLMLDQSRGAGGYVERLLRYLGIEATLVADQEAVLPQLTEANKAGKPYRIAILDQPKHASDAIVLGQTIRHLSEFDSLQLAVLIGLGHRGDTALFERVGFDAYMSKPLTGSTLVKILRRLLNGRKDLGSAQREIVTRYMVEQRDESRVETQHFTGRALLVEDVLANRKVAGAMLGRLGVEVDYAENGLQAVLLRKKTQYDIIFMDCRMPEMDGYKATRIIRQQEREGRVPIVALTANAMPRERRQCTEAGMDDIILKPFTKGDLANCLKRWIGKGGDRDNDAPTILLDKPPTEVDSTLDISVVEKLKKEMDEDFTEIMDAIRQSIDEILVKLKHEHASLPANEVARLAHSLKSPSATIGAKRLYEMAKDFEQQADQGRVGDISTRVLNLNQEFEQVSSLLNEKGY
jgi:PAS domain S-box-containing protein